jgi:MraZ protein
MRFLGNFEARLDAKSRVFVPAPFRRLLQADGQPVLYLRKDVFEECLILYPPVLGSRIDSLEPELAKWNPLSTSIFRQYTCGTVMVEMDANGSNSDPRQCFGKRQHDDDIVFFWRGWTP